MRAHLVWRTALRWRPWRAAATGTGHTRGLVPARHRPSGSAQGCGPRLAPGMALLAALLLTALAAPAIAPAAHAATQTCSGDLVKTGAGPLQVVAPASTQAPFHSSVTLSFTVRNLATIPVTADLTATSDRGWPTIVNPSSVTIPADSVVSVEVTVTVADASATGTVTSKITLTAVDSVAGNPPAAASTQVTGVPNPSSAPRPHALNAVTVERGGMLSLRYRIEDPDSLRATVIVRITRLNKLIKTIDLGSRPTGRTLSHSFRCWLAPGNYNWRLYAVDAEGHPQAKVPAGQRVKRLLVR